jgi:hypothetical protein
LEAREGKKVKYVFANTTAQRGRKLNHHANTPAAVKMKEIGENHQHATSHRQTLSVTLKTYILEISNVN